MFEAIWDEDFVMDLSEKENEETEQIICSGRGRFAGIGSRTVPRLPHAAFVIKKRIEDEETGQGRRKRGRGRASLIRQAMQNAEGKLFKPRMPNNDTIDKSESGADKAMSSDTTKPKDNHLDFQNQEEYPSLQAEQATQNGENHPNINQINDANGGSSDYSSDHSVNRELARARREKEKQNQKNSFAEINRQMFSELAFTFQSEDSYKPVKVMRLTKANLEQHSKDAEDVLKVTELMNAGKKAKANTSNETAELYEQFGVTHDDIWLFKQNKFKMPQEVKNKMNEINKLSKLFYEGCENDEQNQNENEGADQEEQNAVLGQKYLFDHTEHEKQVDFLSMLYDEDSWSNQKEVSVGGDEDSNGDIDDCKSDSFNLSKKDSSEVDDQMENSDVIDVKSSDKADIRDGVVQDKQEIIDGNTKHNSASDQTDNLVSNISTDEDVFSEKAFDTTNPSASENASFFSVTSDLDITVKCKDSEASASHENKLITQGENTTVIQEVTTEQAVDRDNQPSEIVPDDTDSSVSKLASICDVNESSIEIIDSDMSASKDLNVDNKNIVLYSESSDKTSESFGLVNGAKGESESDNGSVTKDKRSSIALLDEFNIPEPLRNSSNNALELCESEDDDFTVIQPKGKKQKKKPLQTCSGNLVAISEGASSKANIKTKKNKTQENHKKCSIDESQSTVKTDRHQTEKENLNEEVNDKTKSQGKSVQLSDTNTELDNKTNTTCKDEPNKKNGISSGISEINICSAGDINGEQFENADDMGGFQVVKKKQRKKKSVSPQEMQRRHAGKQENTIWKLYGKNVLQVEGLPLNFDVDILTNIVNGFGTVKDFQVREVEHTLSVRYRLPDEDSCDYAVQCIDQSNIGTALSLSLAEKSNDKTATKEKTSDDDEENYQGYNQENENNEDTADERQTGEERDTDRTDEMDERKKKSEAQSDQSNQNQQNRDSQAKQNKGDAGSRQNEQGNGREAANQNQQNRQLANQNRDREADGSSQNGQGNGERPANQNQQNGQQMRNQGNGDRPANQNQQKGQQPPNHDRDTDERPGQNGQGNAKGPLNLKNKGNQDNGNAQTNTNEQSDSNARGSIRSNIRDRITNSKNNANSQGKNNANSQDNAQKNRNTKSRTPASSMLTGKKKVPPSKKKAFDKSFSSKSIVSFDGETFNSDGSLTASFKETLIPKAQTILADFDAKFPNVIDYEGTFGEKAESLVLFINKFTEKFEENQDIFEKFFNTPDQLGTEDMKKIPLAFLASLKTEVLGEKMNNIVADTKETVCYRLGNKETTPNHVRKILRFVNCQTLLAKAGRCKNPITEVLAGDFERSTKTVRALTDRQCKTTIDEMYFCALSYKTIRKCSATFLFENLQRLGDDEATLRMVFKVIFASRQARSIITTEADIISMKGKLHYLTPDYLRVIAADLIMSTLEQFKLEAGKMEDGTKMAIGKIIISQRNLADLRGTELLNALHFLRCNKRITNQLNSKAIEAQIDEILKLDLDESCNNFFAKEDPYKQDPSRVTSNEIFKEKKKILKRLSAREFDKMNLNYKGLLDDGTFQDLKPEKKATRRAIVKNLIKENNLRDFKREDFKKFGTLIQDLKVEEVDECNKEELVNGLKEAIKENSEVVKEMEGPAAEKIVEMMTEEGDIQLEDLGGLMSKVSAKRLMSQDSAMLGDLSGETERNITCEKEQCPILYNAFREESGPPGVENSNYTQSVINNLDSIMSGMPVSDMTNLPPTKIACEAMKKNMSEKQLSILNDKVKYKFGLMSEGVNVADRVTSDDIQQCGEALKMFSVEELNQFPTDLRQAALENIAQANLSDVSMENLEEFTSLYLEEMGKESGPLSVDDTENLGNLFCGLTDDKLDDVVAEAIPDKSIFDSCPTFTESKCKKFVKAVKRKKNKADTDPVDEDVLLEIGECIVDVDEEDLEQISDEVIEDNEKEIMKCVEKSERKKKKLSINRKEEKKIKETRVKKAVVGAKTRNKQRSSGRSRRSAVSLTCDEMQDLGSGVTAMTTAQIAAMADMDFLDCAYILGQYSDWSTNQITALTDVATRTGTFNTPSLWTADNVESAGVITQGLTPNELSTLTQLTVEAMFSIGRHEGWSDAQLEAGFARWLDLRGGMPSGISSTDFVALGHFACGATTNHINQMNATEYSLAASHIGRLASCQEHQLEAYVTLAKNINAFGNVSTWSTSVISSVGSVIDDGSQINKITFLSVLQKYMDFTERGVPEHTYTTRGGLNAYEIGSLSTDQVAVIEPETIALIPPSSFVGFTADQLSSFTLSQSTAVTQNQQAGLSQDQLLALAEAGATLFSTAQCLTIPAILTFIPITLAYVFHI